MLTIKLNPLSKTQIDRFNLNHPSYVELVKSQLGLRDLGELREVELIDQNTHQPIEEPYFDDIKFSLKRKISAHKNILESEKDFAEVWELMDGRKIWIEEIHNLPIKTLMKAED